MSNYAYLISLNFVHQVAECWQPTESDHGLALLTAQTFHFGQGCASQDNLFTSQEVLELRVIRRLTGKSYIKVITTSDVSDKHRPLKILQCCPVVVASYLIIPFRLIFAKSMAKVI